MRTMIAVIQVHIAERQDRSLRPQPISNAEMAEYMAALDTRLSEVMEEMGSDDGPVFNIKVFEGIHEEE